MVSVVPSWMIKRLENGVVSVISCFVVTWPFFIQHTKGPSFYLLIIIIFSYTSFLKVWLVPIHSLASSLINWYKTKAQVIVKRWYIKKLVTELTFSPNSVCMHFKVWVSLLLTSTSLLDTLKWTMELGGKCPPLLLWFGYGAIYKSECSTTDTEGNLQVQAPRTWLEDSLYSSFPNPFQKMLQALSFLRGGLLQTAVWELGIAFTKSKFCYVNIYKTKLSASEIHL